MSSSQQHGKEFERRILKTCFGVDPEQVRSNSIFDIPLGVTSASSDPVSIKTCEDGVTVTVYLSDACRVWSWDSRVRLIVGLWSQFPGLKVFHTVWDLHITLDEIAKTKLFGSVQFCEVKALHQGLLDRKSVPAEQVRQWAYATRAELEPRLGLIHLAPKIDSKKQRRLQCSALLHELAGAAARAEVYERRDFQGLQLPFALDSTPRERKKRVRSHDQPPEAPRQSADLLDNTGVK